ncbi:MAG: OmpA family protein [Gammaproteobacteria bacterium]|nr:OmpA family protein [Gammaproteobacteria bacterium]
MTNLGLLIALLASLGLLFWVFHITIKQVSTDNEASMRLIHDLVDKCVNATRECNGTSTDEHGPIEPAPKNTDNFHSRPVVPGHTPSVTNTSGDSKTFLKVGRFTIFGSGPGFDRADIVKDIIKDSATAPAEQAEAILKAIGVALDDAEKAAGAVSAWVDTYRKIFPGKQSCPTVLPTGTLLDRQVEFDFDSARLEDPGMLDALKTLAETVREENIDVLIEGHADSVGSTSYNQHLSELRAKAVRDFLVTRHVLPNQLHTKGYGEGYLWLPYQPTSALNRRVRIVQCVIGTEDRCTE